MTDLDIKLPATVDSMVVQTIVDDVGRRAALKTTMKTTLKSYPGSIHWHFKKGTERGILEVTWWPRNAQPPRLWLSVHGNREAPWTAELLPRLKAEIEARLADLG